MARTSSAVLAALIAVAPFAAAHAQESAEQTPPPVTAPAETPAPPPAAPGEPTTEPAEAAPAEAPAETPTAPEGQAAAPGEQVGSYYAKSTHGDWQLRCLRTPDGKDPCELYQLLRDDQETPVAELSVIPFTGEAAAVLNFVAPLETDLQAGMGLQIDAGEARRYPFMVCAAIGCVSRLGMSGEELNLLKRGSNATVTLLPFGGNPDENMVDLSVSLTGFTAGFTELESVMAETE